MFARLLKNTLVAVVGASLLMGAVCDEDDLLTVEIDAVEDYYPVTIPANSPSFSTSFDMPDIEQNTSVQAKLDEISSYQSVYVQTVTLTIDSDIASDWSWANSAEVHISDRTSPIAWYDGSTASGKTLTLGVDSSVDLLPYVRDPDGYTLDVTVDGTSPNEDIVFKVEADYTVKVKLFD